MSNVMGIYVKFYHDHSLNMVMSLDPGCKFRKFLFLPNSILNVKNSYKIGWKLAQEQKCYIKFIVITNDTANRHNFGH